MRTLCILQIIVAFSWTNTGSLAGECCIAYTDVRNLTQPQINCDDYCCGHVNYLLCCSVVTKRAEGYLISKNCSVKRYWIEDNYWQVILGTLTFIVLYILGIVYIRNKRKKSIRKREALVSSMPGPCTGVAPLELVQRNTTKEIVLRPPECTTEPPAYVEITAKENRNTLLSPPSYEEVFTISHF